ncbi:hypothetical protein, partial [Bradyrhizobium yuanmingense]|uniref:hypothetical protein n=1 Tax=Bradyrhizobium yuanmingense TaxID=108015 RepID=UPI001AEC4EDF
PARHWLHQPQLAAGWCSTWKASLSVELLKSIVRPILPDIVLGNGEGRGKDKDRKLNRSLANVPTLLAIRSG